MSSSGAAKQDYGLEAEDFSEDFSPPVRPVNPPAREGGPQGQAVAFAPPPAGYSNPVPSPAAQYQVQRSTGPSSGPPAAGGAPSYAGQVPIQQYQAQPIQQPPQSPYQSQPYSAPNPAAPGPYSAQQPVYTPQQPLPAPPAAYGGPAPYSGQQLPPPSVQQQQGQAPYAVPPYNTNPPGNTSQPGYFVQPQLTPPGPANVTQPGMPPAPAQYHPAPFQPLLQQPGNQPPAYPPPASLPAQPPGQATPGAAPPLLLRGGAAGGGAGGHLPVGAGLPAPQLASGTPGGFGLEQELADAMASQLRLQPPGTQPVSHATGVLGLGGPGMPPPGSTMVQGPPLFTLDQLPTDQRLVHLTDIQANDLMQQLTAQAQSGGTAPPKMVDVSEAHRHLMGSLGAQTMDYIHTVELAIPDKRFPLNARPSLLQTKLKHGRNRLQDLVQPIVEPGQQRFVDLAFTPDGALLEEAARVWQCGLRLVRADGVGPTGLRHERNPCLYVARMALFDRSRNRFLGNIIGVRPEGVTQKDTSWQFREHERIIVRCNCVQPDPRTGTRLVNDDALSIYIELNTSYRLDIADTKHMPPHESKAAKMVDEVTSAWSMLSFKRCCQAAKEQEVSVPLYYGSLFHPQSLDALYKARRKATPFSSLLKPKVKPVLVFKAGPLTTSDPPSLLPYGFLPSTMMAPDDLAMALGAYRVVMGLQMARQPSAFCPLADPVLAQFPKLLSDSHLLTEFLVKWRDSLSKLQISTKEGCLSPQYLPPIAMVVELFRRCAAEVEPLIHCTSLPPRHINNFVEYQGHRLKLVQQFCHVIDPKTNTVAGSRHPVDPMSHAGFEFLHAPFDVAETRFCMGDHLGDKSTFLQY